MTLEYRVTAESLGHQAIGAFRTMADAEVAVPTGTARRIASRKEIPWHLVVRRKVQAIVNFEPKKKETL